MKFSILVLTVMSIVSGARADTGIVGPPPNLFAQSNHANASPTGLLIGVGWPDAKIRYDFQAPIGIEGKYAIGDGVWVGSGRAYWRYLEVGGAELTTGLEGGYVSLNGAENVSGSGWEAQVFGGVEMPLWSNRIRLAVDLGPTWLNLNSSGQGVSAMEWVVTTGLYLRLF